jgi:hypothetical protein
MTKEIINMSADNGIYILKTKDQYRVIHAQAIDNLWWSAINSESQREMVPTRIVEYYGDTKYTRDELKALQIANSMAKNTYILEYGIKTFEINKNWKQIVKEAKEMAPKEIEALKKLPDNRWDYEISILEKIIAS